MQVFISYAQEDIRIAHRLCRDLEAGGISVWIDKKRLVAGQEWRIEITKAIHESSYFIALVSSVSVSKRGYVQRELRLALDILDEMPPSEIFVIPVRLNACIPRHPRLEQIHRIDLFPSYRIGLKQLWSALHLDPAREKIKDWIMDVLHMNSGGMSERELRTQLRGNRLLSDKRKFPDALAELEHQRQIESKTAAGTTKFFITVQGRYSLFL